MHALLVQSELRKSFLSSNKNCYSGNLTDWGEEVQKCWGLPSVRVKSFRRRVMQRKERVMLVGFAHADI